MKQYYIIRNNHPAGPYTLEELTTISITPDTMVWTEDLEDWTPACQISELDTLFAPSSQTSSRSKRPTYEYTPTAESFPPERPPMPPNYLAWSILVAIFCCRIGGIVAIVYSAQVSSRYLSGDYEGALKYSRNARTWIMISVGAIVVYFFIFLAVSLIGWLSN